MADDLTPAVARDIARRAYIYGFPLVENYGLMYSQTQQMGFNNLVSTAKLYGPEDQEVVTPNNDTCYSQAWLDLGHWPVQFKLGPVTPADRYWSFQIVDAFTNNIQYIGRRATGEALEPQTYTFAGPQWSGSDDPNTIHCPGRFIFLLGRTQLFDAADVDAVKAIQATYRVEGPSSLPPRDFIPYTKARAETLEFFSYMNLVFTFQAPPEGDDALMAEFSQIGVGPGCTFDPSSMDRVIQEALSEGMKDGMDQILEAARNVGQVVGGWNMPKVDQQYFGTTWPDYVFRGAIGYKGIYANSPIEALYPLADLDSQLVQLTGAEGRCYQMRFPPGGLPPVQFFWSITMYFALSKYLVPNPIDRYSISNRTPDIKYGDDGSLTFYLQYDEPADGRSNWLPAPNEAFYIVLRMYGPEGDALAGEYGHYVVPPLELV